MEALRAKIDTDRYADVLNLFEFQAAHAIVWRDAIDNWFQKISGIADTQGRVGHTPDRIEAEAMQATGYKPIKVTPWETASGGKAMTCHIAAGCTLQATLDRPAGTYNIAVQYFDQWLGASQYDLLLNGKSIAR